MCRIITQLGSPDGLKLIMGRESYMIRPAMRLLPIWPRYTMLKYHGVTPYILNLPLVKLVFVNSIEHN